MMRRTLSVALLTLTALLAGCAEGDGGEGGETPTASPSATTAPPADPCPTVASATLVPGWTKHGGDWGPVAAAEGRVELVCGEATKALSSLVRDEGTFSDLEANVSFSMQAGDSGAGLVVHFADDRNYNIVRYSPREQGWHLFTVIAGNRQKQDAASVTPPTTNPELGQWVALRVTSRDGHLEAWDGAVKVIDYMLPAEASHEGRIGYFLRDTGMAAYFDDFQARAL